MENMNLAGNNFSSLYELQNGFLQIFGSIFTNLTISFPLIIISNDGIINESGTSLIESTLFQNIIDCTISDLNLISINFFCGNFSIQNTNFTKISFFQNIIEFDKGDGYLEIQKVNFIQNEVLFQLLTINNCYNVTLRDVTCNFTNDKNGTLFNSGGGGIKFYNTQFRTIFNLKITNSFSGKTTFGVKFIDDFARININGSSPFVIFKNKIKIHKFFNQRYSYKIVNSSIIFCFIKIQWKQQEQYFWIVLTISP